MFKIATWNVNSIKVRLPHVLDWLASVKPDVLALQETKSIDENFPQEDFREAGYEVIFSGQKTYNGVAIVSRVAPQDVITDLPNLTDPQRRILAATYDNVRVLNVYVPNGQSVGSEKFEYKLKWLKSVRKYIKKQLKEYSHFVILGDFNIIPEARDVYDPAEWEGHVLFSEPEREAFKLFLKEGLHDSFRLFEHEGSPYTWWDYRAAAFRRNRGVRIDHILVSEDLKTHCQQCWIDKEPRKLERPSDHTPIIAEFDI